jgi:HEAT repeat protein
MDEQVIKLLRDLEADFENPDPERSLLSEIAEALAMHGVAAVPALPKVEVLLDENEWTRVIGVEAILKIDPSRTEELSPVLAEALGSRSRLIRHQVVQTLADLPNAGRMAVPELTEALDDEDEIVRMEALNSLEHLGSAAAPAVPKLVQILQGAGKDGSDILIRGMAAAVLAAIGEDRLHETGEPLGRPLSGVGPARFR